MDREAIQRILPHRDPFLFLDRVVVLEKDHAAGVKDVKPQEPYFQGHFPGNPVMPGVLIVEALAQLVGVMALARPEHRGRIGYFASINSVRFRGIVRPGDTLKLEVKTIKEKSIFISTTGKAMVNDKVVCEAEIMLAVGDSDVDS